MTYQEFITYIKNDISSRLTNGRTVRIEQITKNNNTVYDALVISDPFINISPTIYVNQYYYLYLSGTSLTDICDIIFETYQKSVPIKDFDVSLFRDFSHAKPYIVMKLINAAKNHTLLQKIPHIPYLDMAIIFVYCATDFNETFSTILIKNSHLELWNIEQDELYEIAKKNTPLLLPSNLEPIQNILQYFDPNISFTEKIPLYILTNQLRVIGATTLLYEGTLKQIATNLGSDLILIPSSVHEVILFPATKATMELSGYNKMIQEINETQLAGDELLSDHVYYYNRETDEVTM